MNASASTAPAPVVCFSHGQESGPFGTKIQALSEVAQAAGFAVESLDYRGLDPEARVERLRNWCAAQAAAPVLVGSSLGAYVALCVSGHSPVAGSFLLAPAVYLPGGELPTPRPPATPLVVVHGWRDDVVPVASAIRYAREAQATLHVLDGDHRLSGNLHDLRHLFGHFLRGLKAGPSAQGPAATPGAPAARAGRPGSGARG